MAFSCRHEQRGVSPLITLVHLDATTTEQMLHISRTSELGGDE
jgi:hypothetical protein